MAEFPAPMEGIALTHFIVSDDVERSRRFYADVLGGEQQRLKGEPTIIALANGWVIINVGWGPYRRQANGHARNAPRPGPGEQLPQHSSGRHPGDL